MIHHRFPVLRELLLCHVPRRDILGRMIVDFWIQMHSPRRTHDQISSVERVPTQLSRLHYDPTGHRVSRKTEGLLDRRVQ